MPFPSCTFHLHGYTHSHAVRTKSFQKKRAWTITLRCRSHECTRRCLRRYRDPLPLPLPASPEVALKSLAQPPGCWSDGDSRIRLSARFSAVSAWFDWTDAWSTRSERGKMQNPSTMRGFKPHSQSTRRCMMPCWRSWIECMMEPAFRPAARPRATHNSSTMSA